MRIDASQPRRRRRPGERAAAPHRPLFPRPGRRPVPPRPRPRRGADRAGHAVGIICDSSTGGDFEERTLRPPAPVARARPQALSHAPPDRAVGSRRRLARAARGPVTRSRRPARPRRQGRRLCADDRHPLAGIWYRASPASTHRMAAACTTIRRSLAGRVYFAAERVLERMTDALDLRQPVRGGRLRAKVGPPRPPVDARPQRAAPGGVRPDRARRRTRSISSSSAMLRDLKGPDVFIEALAEICTARAASRRRR